MHPFTIGAAAFIAIFGGALLGMGIARRLPHHHRDADSRNAVLVSMALVSTLSALVLGLMITQSNASHMRRADAIAMLGTDIQRLDRTLLAYGVSATASRMQLKAYARNKLADLSSGKSPATSLDLLEKLTVTLVRLNPQHDEHRYLKQQAIGMAGSMNDARWLLASNTGQSLPTPFLAMLIFWLTLLFVMFGLFSPRNGTVIVALLCCAIAVSGGVYMIVELATPYDGLIVTQTTPLKTAIVALAR